MHSKENLAMSFDFTSGQSIPAYAVPGSEVAQGGGGGAMGGQVRRAV